ncbi:hypothetical protein GCM10009795_096500 [Nocardioides hankookensis]|uniref:Uncharacterized protein n=1 Tax=Nocardioides hankookensis TaxID=443157 RepID=A0ABW1LLQ4_9ACTN
MSGTVRVAAVRGPGCAPESAAPASTPGGRLRALWAAEDRALARWERADVAHQAAIRDRDEKVAAARERRGRAMQPYTPTGWGRVVAYMARDTPRDLLIRRGSQDPVTIARIAERVDRATQRLDEITKRADAQVEAARRNRATATRDLYEVQPNAHLIFGITRNALTRMMRDQ